MTHRDQTRVRSALIPALMTLTFSDEASAVNDCTLLNRALLQGPDPLFLMKTCPSLFAQLCSEIGLSVEDGVWAIETAHVRGPGCLLDFDNLSGGIQIDSNNLPHAITTSLRQEALWLILANCSETTESEYTAEVSLEKRFQAITLAAVRLDRSLNSCRNGWYHNSGWYTIACSILARMSENTSFHRDEQGILVGDDDIAFYLGYKRGERVVGCHVGDKVFYGTIPGTTLSDENVAVETNVSPSYGFRRVG